LEIILIYISEWCFETLQRNQKSDKLIKSTSYTETPPVRLLYGKKTNWFTLLVKKINRDTIT